MDALDQLCFTQRGSGWFNAILHECGDGNTLLQQTVLSAAMRAPAMHAPSRMTATDATLFPDLDGLARSPGYELEAIWNRLVEDDKRDESEPTPDKPARP